MDSLLYLLQRGAFILYSHSHKIVFDTFSTKITKKYDTFCRIKRPGWATFRSYFWPTPYPVDDPRDVSYWDPETDDIACEPSILISSESKQLKTVTAASGVAALFYPQNHSTLMTMFTCQPVECIKFTYRFIVNKTEFFSLHFTKIYLSHALGGSTVKVFESFFLKRRASTIDVVLTGLYSNFSYFACQRNISADISLYPCISLELTFTYQTEQRGICSCGYCRDNWRIQTGVFSYQFTQKFFVNTPLFSFFRQFLILLATFILQVPKLYRICITQPPMEFKYTVYDGPDFLSQELSCVMCFLRDVLLWRCDCFLTSTFQGIILIKQSNWRRNLTPGRKLYSHKISFRALETNLTSHSYSPDMEFPFTICLPTTNCIQPVCVLSLSAHQPQKFDISILKFEYTGQRDPSCTVGGLLTIETTPEYTESIILCTKIPQVSTYQNRKFYSHSSNILVMLFWYPHHCTIKAELSSDNQV